MLGIGIGTISMGPVYAIAGTAFVSKFIEDFMQNAGRGNWVWFVNTVLYVLVGVYALHTWYGGVRAIAGIFGVMVP